MLSYRYMNETEHTPTNVTEPMVTPPSCSMKQRLDMGLVKQRGRPRLNVKWPEGEFTFDNLNEKNVLSSSSLRKKMRAELQKGKLVKTGTLKAAFGRPQNVYKRA